MSHEKIHKHYENVIIIGPGMGSFQAEDISALKKESFYVIGDGRRDLSQRDIIQLRDVVAEGANIFIAAHGNPQSMLFSKRTELVYQDFMRVFTSPVNLHIMACKSGGALSAVNNLPKGSKLYTYALEREFFFESMPKFLSTVRAVKSGGSSSKSKDLAVLRRFPYGLSCAKSDGSLRRVAWGGSSSSLPTEVLTKPAMKSHIMEEYKRVFGGCGYSRVKKGDISNQYIKGYRYCFLGELIKQNNVELFEAYHNAYPEVVGAYLGTPDFVNDLSVAAEEGHVNIFRLLNRLEVNLDQPKKDGTTPIHVAAGKGNVETVEFLAKTGVDLDRVVDKGTPACVAAQNGHADVVRLLGRLGADLNKAAKKGYPGPLYFSAQNGYADVVNALIEKRVDVDAAVYTGATSLYVAAQNGHSDVLRLLVSAGANVNVVANDGSTPACVASQNGHGGCVEVLIESGADFKKGPPGWSPKHLASTRGHKNIVKMIREAERLKLSSAPHRTTVERPHAAAMQCVAEACHQPVAVQAIGADNTEGSVRGVSSGYGGAVYPSESFALQLPLLAMTLYVISGGSIRMQDFATCPSDAEIEQERFFVDMCVNPWMPQGELTPRQAQTIKYEFLEKEMAKKTRRARDSEARYRQGW